MHAEQSPPVKRKVAESFREIEMSQIDAPAHVLRAEIDDHKLEELANDIRDNGLYYPIIVRKAGDRYEVVDGHRRYLAHQRLGLIKVRCIVHDQNSPPPEAVKLKTNLLREDNTDAEIAVWLGELAQTHNYSLEHLCKMVGRSESWINDRVDLLRGDPDVLQALGERKINFSHAKVLNRCPDKALRAMGLHFAIVDQLPAVRLHEWFVRNLQVQSAPGELPVAAAAGNGEAAPIGPGIVCDWCGGSQDPQNMVSVWLHRWEWDLVLKVRDGYTVQKEA